MLGEQVQMPDAAWRRLNLSWIVFFALMGVANLLVAFNFSTETWVSFKLFGGIGLMVLFVLAQGLFLAKYVDEKGSS
jgi:intracellular septation protein